MVRNNLDEISNTGGFQTWELTPKFNKILSVLFKLIINAFQLKPFRDKAYIGMIWSVSKNGFGVRCGAEQS